MESSEKRWNFELTRREFVASAAAGAALPGVVEAQPKSAETPATTRCSLTINDQQHDLSLDPRVTLLDLLREHLHLTGSKKGCGHGQCGACTVLLDGRRVNSCLLLAVACDGRKIVTIEGLARDGALHPVQKAFVDFDGYQCGYCTPGQICSAVAMLEELNENVPSAVTRNISKLAPIDLTDDEIRERMAGNLCRCGAYPNIVAALRDVHQQRRSG